MWVPRYDTRGSYFRVSLMKKSKPFFYNSNKINAMKLIYMHIKDKDESSSKKKDLALKTSQKKGKTKILVEEESSNDDDLNANIDLMVKKTTKC
jgi:hypothetical protein